MNPGGFANRRLARSARQPERRGHTARWCVYILFAVAVLIVAAGCRGNRAGKQPPSLVRTMTVTAYCDCKQCCGWKRTWYGKPVHAYGAHQGKRKRIGVTASGSEAKVGTLAADTTKYPFGTMMYVPGYGYGRVEDRGSAINGDHIDVFFKSHKEALQWGRQQHVVRVWYQKRDIAALR